jgi:DNA polymerase alpha subunit B
LFYSLGFFGPDFGHSLYPIFPVPLDNSQEVNLDVSHSGLLDLEGESEDNAPHVLILPSRLKYFAKVDEQSVTKNLF